MLCIIQRGASGATAYTEELGDLVIDHAPAWKVAYGVKGIKPKWHILLHFPGEVKKFCKMMT
jgi:hypothetical protein